MEFRGPLNRSRRPRRLRHRDVLAGIRARVEHVFAQQKDKMGLFIRTIGIKRAEAKITLANEVHLDLIMTDVNLNGKRSLDMIEQLHKAPATSKIPIITLSALHLSEIQVEARAAGAVASLEKPVRLQTLLEVIKEYEDGGYGQIVRGAHMRLHAGTHVDAPFHSPHQCVFKEG